MIRRLFLCMVCGVFTMASAQKAPVWKDAGVNQQNREPRRAHFFGFESEDKAKGDKEASERFLSMEGKWKFNFVKNHQDAPQGFYALKYDDSKWVDFPVPGLFEMEGYGDKIYKNMGYAWCTTFKNNPPYVGETNNYTGSYRRTFDLPQNWKGQEVYFHVGSATSNLSVWVNGKYVGYSEDSKVAAEFNITKYLKPGKNLIAMQIMRWCDGSYLEDQDFWRFTGIAREVYLYATPKVHVKDITIGQDYQQGNGLLSVDVKLAGKAAVEAKLFDAAGNQVQTRVDMYNPLYYLLDHYDGSGTSEPAGYWRIRTGICQGDTALTTEVNLALAIASYGPGHDVDFETVWGMGHTMAERKGESTANFIAWVRDCMGGNAAGKEVRK